LTPDGANRAGPSLHGIFGRRIATLPGYTYSPPLQSLDIVWSAETVAKLFELGPDVLTPGSKMPLQKITDKSQRDALIAYLKHASVAAP
jgi:cytochrome c